MSSGRGLPKTVMLRDRIWYKPGNQMRNFVKIAEIRVAFFRKRWYFYSDVLGRGDPPIKLKEEKTS